MPVALQMGMYIPLPSEEAFMSIGLNLLSTSSYLIFLSEFYAVFMEVGLLGH